MVKGVLYLDIENTDDRLLVCGWAKGDGPVEQADTMPPEFSDPEWAKVSAGDHDMLWPALHGWDPQGPWYDTQVMAYVLDENQPLDLGSLVARYTEGQSKEKSITERGGRLWFKGTYPLDEFGSWLPAVKRMFMEYNVNDVETLRSLYLSLAEGLIEQGFDQYWLREEVPYSRLILNMERRGLPVNLEDTKVLADEIRAQKMGSEFNLRGYLPTAVATRFNLNSAPQLRQYLFTKWFTLPDKLPMDMDPLPSDRDFEITKVGRLWIEGHWIVKGRGLEPTPPPKKKPGEPKSVLPSTSSPALLYKHGTDEFVRELCLVYRKHEKLLGTYLDKFPRIAVGEGLKPGTSALDNQSALPRIYGRYNQTGTVTGRLSSSDPNMQNMPARGPLGKRVRGLFQGRFVIGDYDSLEMRIMAHFSGDPRLIELFQSGGDPHEATARAIFGACDGHDDPRRDQGKLVNYATGYQSGARTLAVSLSLAGFPTTQTVAGEYQKIMAQAYPRLFRWITQEQRTPGGVSTLAGRRRRLYDDSDDWEVRAYKQRQRVNTKVQGSAADIFRRCMLQAEKWFPELLFLAAIHDEAIWEYQEVPTPGRLAFLQRVMETGHGFDLKVPMVFVPMVCDTWQEKGVGVDLEEAGAVAV